MLILNGSMSHNMCLINKSISTPLIRTWFPLCFPSNVYNKWSYTNYIMYVAFGRLDPDTAAPHFRRDVPAAVPEVRYQVEFD